MQRDMQSIHVSHFIIVCVLPTNRTHKLGAVSTVELGKLKHASQLLQLKLSTFQHDLCYLDIKRFCSVTDQTCKISFRAELRKHHRNLRVGSFDFSNFAVNNRG